jgi:hypothetical protein
MVGQTKTRLNPKTHLMTPEIFIGTAMLGCVVSTIALILWATRHSVRLDQYCPRCECYWGFGSDGALVRAASDLDRFMYYPHVCPICQEILLQEAKRDSINLTKSSAPADDATRAHSLSLADTSRLCKAKAD